MFILSVGHGLGDKTKVDEVRVSKIGKKPLKRWLKKNGFTKIRKNKYELKGSGKRASIDKLTHGKNFHDVNN